MQTTRKPTVQIIVMVLCLQGVRAGDSPGDSADAQAVWRLREQTEAAFRQADPQALAATLARDADLILPDGMILRGREAIIGWHAEYFARNKGVRVRFTRRALRFIRPDVAIEDAVWEESGGQPGYPTRGFDSVVVVKQDGQWLSQSLRVWLPPAGEPQQPPCRFDIQPAPQARETSDGTFGVGWIRVLWPGDDPPAQEIAVEMDEADLEWTQWGLEKQDVNFDGWLDIAVRQFGGAKWGRLHWWLYDPASKTFCSNALTRELGKLTHASFRADAATRQIHLTRFHGAELTEYVYRIVNGHLVLAESRPVNAAQGEQP